MAKSVVQFSNAPPSTGILNNKPFELMSSCFPLGISWALQCARWFRTLCVCHQMGWWFPIGNPMLALDGIECCGDWFIDANVPDFGSFHYISICATNEIQPTLHLLGFLWTHCLKRLAPIGNAWCRVFLRFQLEWFAIVSFHTNLTSGSRMWAPHRFRATANWSVHRHLRWCGHFLRTPAPSGQTCGAQYCLQIQSWRWR